MVCGVGVGLVGWRPPIRDAGVVSSRSTPMLKPVRFRRDRLPHALIDDR